MPSVIGHETGNKPFPLIVHRNAHLFADVERVIDIGAGTGRFVKYFLLGEYRCGEKPSYNGKLYHVKAPLRFPVKEYVAIEPHRPFCEKLKRIGDSRLKVICAKWEDVRDEFIGKAFDVVVLWDVVMYMDLRSIHRVNDPLKALLIELEYWIRMAKRYFLFSLHPVKYLVIEERDFSKILRYLDNHRKLRMVDKAYLNRFYEVVPE